MENEVTSVKRRNLPKRGKNEVTRMVLNLKRSILRLTTKMGIAYLARRATGNCRRSKKQNGQQRWQKKEERGDTKDAKAEKGTKKRRKSQGEEKKVTLAKKTKQGFRAQRHITPPTGFLAATRFFTVLEFSYV